MRNALHFQYGQMFLLLIINSISVPQQLKRESLQMNKLLNVNHSPQKCIFFCFVVSDPELCVPSHSY